MRLEAIPGVEELRDLAPPLAGGKLSLGIATIGRLPRRLRYALPVFQVLQARLREPAQEGVATSA